MSATRLDLGYINVDQFDSIAKRGTFGGGFVPDARAKPGDVILWYSTDRQEAHIGFCATPRCTQTWSNSSYYGTFAPMSHSITLDGYYPFHEVWEPVRVPLHQAQQPNVKPQLLVGPAPKPSPSEHPAEFYSVAVATTAYVKREHPSGNEHPGTFTPNISCIQIGADRKSAIVNFESGPANDPIATTVIFANTQHAPLVLSPSIKSAGAQGWAPVAATTSILTPHLIQQPSVRSSVVATSAEPCS